MPSASAGAASHTPHATQTTSLELRDVHKSFGAVRALDGVSMTVRPGTVHALLGENGAGKTTLMRVAFGLLSADSGAVLIRGRSVAGSGESAHTPARAIASGLGMVHQHFTLVSAMTVAENVALGAQGRYSSSAVAARIRAIGERTGLRLDPTARVGELPIGAQQRCEIVKALARDARVLILDEPTAVLAPDEAQALLRWIRDFVAEQSDHAVVLITHKLRDALSVADDITVLRRGAYVAGGNAHEFTESSLAEAMLGSDDGPPRVADDVVSRVRRHTTNEDAHNVVLQADAHNVVLQADAISVKDARGVQRVRNASFAVRAGEIVGIAAVEGSGQAELLRAVAGVVPLAGGTLHAPDDVGFVPEDRHRDALLLDASLTENFALRGAGARRGLMPWDSIRARASSALAHRDVRAESVQVLARTLSGGNQQKFILARALDDAPAALVVENPTRGLDFRATAAVHTALRNARDAGIALLLYSSDLDEVLALSDRVLAMHDGELREVARERRAVGRAMLAAP